jgi:probable rRNA maturation factor
MAIRFTVRPEVRRELSPTALARFRRRAARMVQAAALAEKRRGFELSLLLCDDQEIHALNRAYRKKDRPTDVLAFAMREGAGGSLHPTVLGDVVISLETARRQATTRLVDEVEHLFAHGLCHLLGYDHRNDREERVMNARVEALRSEARRPGRVRAA